MSTPDEDGLLGGSIQVVPRLHGSCGRKLIEALLLDTALMLQFSTYFLGIETHNDKGGWNDIRSNDTQPRTILEFGESNASPWRSQ